MCDLYDPDGYGVSFADRAVRAARKSHRCDECQREIRVGDSYRHVSGVWEGDFFAMRMCRRCSSAKAWLLGRGHGWTGGSVLADVRSCVQQELAEFGRLRTELEG